MMKLQEQIELWNETDQYEAIIDISLTNSILGTL